MAKRKRRPSGEVQVALDEFERGGVTVLVAVIIDVEHVPRLEAEWRTLQNEMKRELLAHYPFAAGAAELAGDRLPEIHARELYQSQSLFRNDEAARPGYWKLHRHWMGQAVRILRRARPRITVRSWPAELTEWNRRNLGCRLRHLPARFPTKKSAPRWIVYFSALCLDAEPHHYLSRRVFCAA